MDIDRFEECGTMGRASGRSPRGASAGWKLWVPGHAQWSWGQRERALVLFGSYVWALAVGVFAWGTPLGVAVLLFAFGTHVTSVVDVIRQSAFPGFGRWVPVASASGGLAVGVYAPALVAAAVVAWPVGGNESARPGYLVDCRAYRHAAPERGDWVWLRSSPLGAERVGRVVAVPGDEVDWSDARLRIQGESAPLGVPFRSSWSPDELAFTVPADHFLVNPSATADATGAPLTNGLVLIGRAQVHGRAWAKLDPLWDRRPPGR